ncbi:MAG: chain-length determining protein, partial [Duncaniella sp.]|nr:chain-length determining protein [Duncaniella sp.]
MQDEKYIKTLENEEEIDLLELAAKLWNNRQKIIKWGIYGAVIGLVIAFSIPKEYNTSVKLAPEASDGKQGSSSLSALASMAGFGGMSSSGADAVYPQLYPDVVSSVPFITSLFNVEVETKKDGEKLTVEQYMKDDISSPWWSAILGLPGKVSGWIKGSEEDEEHVLDNFQLN